ncbi:MAG: DegT/DnrJ/EryC1/StrS aminotransferase [Chloroflexi bacterium RBG_16_48_8]|nr:MAG: DegT/DnrJ/EryC1/StrS aminotransferase [Chloroflexi bacterium RBG_16_48_8]
MDWRVPLADLDFGKAERKAVMQVLESRWLSMGEVTVQFEKAFAAMVGAEHAIAVSNATVALHLAVLALGIGEGDEVILPSLTFVATANAIKYTRAQPVFMDVTNETDFNLAPSAIERAINRRTKAIMVMHYGGYLCNMPEILRIAREHNLFVIEDAAHAPGSSLEDRMAGAWGDVGCFSFFANKNLATGEGGMVTTDREDLAEKVRLMRSHGMTTLTWDRHEGHAHSYDVVELGYNYRIDEIRSALGLVQLEKLYLTNALRRDIVRAYREGLKDVEVVSIPFEDHPGVSAAHLFPILLDASVDRSAFIDAMKARGIQTSIHYPPIHLFSYYRGQMGEIHLPVTETIGKREVTLPLFSRMTEAQVEMVVEGVKGAVEEASMVVERS